MLVLKPYGKTVTQSKCSYIEKLLSAIKNQKHIGLFNRSKIFNDLRFACEILPDKSEGRIEAEHHFH